MNKPKAIGTAGETAVVRWLVANGFPHAERRSLKGTYDEGDVTGTPGVCWEIKAGAVAKTAGDGQVEAWLTETETERRNAGADVGVLVMQRAGFGPTRAGSWWAVVTADTLVGLVVSHGSATGCEGAPVRMHLETLVTFLRASGYGTSLFEPAAASA